MIKGKAYQQPPAPFHVGQWVRYGKKDFEVLHSTHTHTQLEGIPKAIANWELKPSRRLRVISTTKQELIRSDNKNQDSVRLP